MFPKLQLTALDDRCRLLALRLPPLPALKNLLLPRSLCTVRRREGGFCCRGRRELGRDSEARGRNGRDCVQGGGGGDDGAGSSAAPRRQNRSGSFERRRACSWDSLPLLQASLRPPLQPLETISRQSHKRTLDLFLCSRGFAL